MSNVDNQHTYLAPQMPTWPLEGINEHNEFIFRFYVLQPCKHMSVSPAI